MIRCDRAIDQPDNYLAPPHSAPHQCCQPRQIQRVHRTGDLLRHWELPAEPQVSPELLSGKWDTEMPTEKTPANRTIRTATIVIIAAVSTHLATTLDPTVGA